MLVLYLQPDAVGAGSGLPGRGHRRARPGRGAARGGEHRVVLRHADTHADSRDGHQTYAVVICGPATTGTNSPTIRAVKPLFTAPATAAA